MRTRHTVITQVLIVVLAGLLLGPAAVSYAQDSRAPSSETGDLDVPGPLPRPGCVRVPLIGSLAPGRSASTEVTFASFWEWSASSAHQPFHWELHTSSYLGDPRDRIVYQGDSRGDGDFHYVRPGLYRWEVTNKGTVGQAWTVCWK